MEQDTEVAYACELEVAGACDPRLLAAAHREFRRRLREDSSIVWGDVRCDDGGHAMIVECSVRALDLKQAKAAVLTIGSQRLKCLGGIIAERAVDARVVGIVIARNGQDSSLPNTERLGWYRLRLRLTAPILRADPTVGPYIVQELPLWQRFRDAVIAWTQSSETAEVILTVYAGSPRDAFDQTRWGLDGVMTAATRSTDYTFEPLAVTWLGNGDPTTRAGGLVG